MIIEEKDLRPNTLPINRIIHGNALSVLKKLPSNSVDCVITSPPYWAKRDYGKETYTVWSGDPNCDHEWIESESPPTKLGIQGHDDPKYKPANIGKPKPGMFCKKCGAWYGQLGLEHTPEMFVDHLIEIFREVKRVLKPHGNVFVVIDDTYCSNWGGGRKATWWSSKLPEEEGLSTVKVGAFPPNTMRKAGIPVKSLCLVPELFAIRMVYELGFILRNKIIWAKRIHIYKEACQTSGYINLFYKRSYSL